MYWWERQYDALARAGFDEFGTSAFRGYVNTWKQNWLEGKDWPEWMKDDIRQGYIAYWNEEHSKEKSAKCSTSKKTAIQKGEGKHCLGSRGMLRLAIEKHKETGERPDIVTLLEESRTSKKTGDIIDKKAKRVITEVKEKTAAIMSERSQGGTSEQCSNLTPHEIQQVYNSVVPITKGFRYGYGSYAEDEVTSRSLMPPPGFVPEETYLSSQQELRETKQECKQLSSRFSKLEQILKDRMGIELGSDDDEETENTRTPGSQGGGTSNQRHDG